jgi:hypothetical protein
MSSIVLIILFASVSSAYHLVLVTTPPECSPQSFQRFLATFPSCTSLSLDLVVRAFAIERYIKPWLPLDLLSLLTVTIRVHSAFA